MCIFLIPIVGYNRAKVVKKQKTAKHWKVYSLESIVLFLIRHVHQIL